MITLSDLKEFYLNLNCGLLRFKPYSRRGNTAIQIHNTVPCPSQAPTSQPLLYCIDLNCNPSSQCKALPISTNIDCIPMCGCTCYPGSHFDWNIRIHRTIGHPFKNSPVHLLATMADICNYVSILGAFGRLGSNVGRTPVNTVSESMGRNRQMDQCELDGLHWRTGEVNTQTSVMVRLSPLTQLIMK
jgi:hypothetical protein